MMIPIKILLVQRSRHWKRRRTLVDDDGHDDYVDNDDENNEFVDAARHAHEETFSHEH